MTYERPSKSNRLYFLAICIAVIALAALSWPIVLSFDLWVMKDRGSFLNADYLLDQHLRLGVDTYYAYGLLPILIQRTVFHLFGRGVAPMLALTFVYFLALAAFCALLRRHLPSRGIWSVAFLALTPIVFWINPTFPYCLVVLSMLYALLFVLNGRYGVALVVTAFGCVSVPSLPLVLAFFLIVLIVVDWMTRPKRTGVGLLRHLIPGVLTYVSLVVLLSVVFGWESTLSTLSPSSGLAHYRAAGYESVLSFLQIGKHQALWYLGNRPAWWIFATSIVLVAAGGSLAKVIANRRVDPTSAFLVVFACVHIVFFTIAYGPGGQHVIYDPLLVAGVLVGLARFGDATVVRRVLVVFVLLGIGSDAVQVKKTIVAWRTTKIAAGTAGLYANAAWMREWNDVISNNVDGNVLVLSYSTAPHFYFPHVESPNVWTLNVAQLNADDHRRVLGQIDAATVVVEDLSSSTAFVDGDADTQRRLRAMCLVKADKTVRVWKRRPVMPASAPCLFEQRRLSLVPPR